MLPRKDRGCEQKGPWNRTIEVPDGLRRVPRTEWTMFLGSLIILGKRGTGDTAGKSLSSALAFWREISQSSGESD